MWDVHDTLLTKCIPKNLIESVRVRFRLSSIIFRVLVNVLANEKLIPNILFLFDTHLFIWNHSVISWIVMFTFSVVIIISRCYYNVSVICICESLPIIFGSSFICILNSTGPRMEPWGTPHFINSQSDWQQWVALYSKDTLCLLVFQIVVSQKI